MTRTVLCAAGVLCAMAAQADIWSNVTSTTNLAVSADTVIRGAAFPAGSLAVNGGRTTIQAADADCALDAKLQGGLSFWLDASKNVVTSNGTDVTQWADVRETMPADPATYTNWVYPRAILATATNADFTPVAPKLLPSTPEFPGKAVVDFGEYKSGEWLSLVGKSGTVAELAVRSFYCVVGFGGTAGFLLGSCTGWNNEGWGTPCFHYGDETNGRGSIGRQGSDASAYQFGETRLNGARINPITTPYNYNSFQLFTQNGPFRYENGAQNYWGGPAKVSALFNDRNYKAKFGHTNRQGGGRLCELLIFDRMFTESESRAIEAYLANKWFGRNNMGRISVASGATLAVTNDTAAYVQEFSGSGTVEKTGSGDLVINGNAPLFGGTFRLAGGACEFAQKTGLTIAPVSGKKVTGSLWRLAATDGAADTYEVTTDSADATVRLGSFDSSVKTLALTGGRLALQAPAAEAATAFEDFADPIVNGSFETPSSGVWKYMDSEALPGWTMPNSSRTGIGNGAGNCPWYTGAIPDGVQIGFIQSVGSDSTSISQDFAVPAQGLYAVRMWMTRRPGIYSDTHVEIRVDGTRAFFTVISPWGEGTTVSNTRHDETDMQEYQVQLPPLTAGTHTLTLTTLGEGTNNAGGDRAWIIDGVRIVPLEAGEFVNIPNADFESSSGIPYARWGCNYYVAYPDNASWTFTGGSATSYATNTETSVVTTNKYDANCGITRFGTWWAPTKFALSRKLTDSRKVFLQRNASISQTVTFPRDGKVRVSLRYSNRVDDSGNGVFASGHSCQVWIGDTLVGAVSPVSEQQLTASMVADVTTGDSTLRLQAVMLADPGADVSCILDDIRIKYIDDGIVKNGSFDGGLGTAWAPLGSVVPSSVSAENGFALSLMQDAGVEQRVTIPSNGVYAVTITSQGPALTDETRNGAGVAENAMYYSHAVKVCIDTNTVVGFVRNDTSEAKRYVLRLPYLTVGGHELSIQGYSWVTASAASLLYKVEIVPLAVGDIADAFDFTRSTIALKTGSTLDLDFKGTLKADKVTLDGQTIAGEISAATYPSLITGPGIINSPAKGTAIQLK